MVCPRCSIDKTIDEFSFRKDTNKYKNICKACDCLRNKVWRQEHVLEEKLRRKRYNKSHREKIREYYREWYSKNGRTRSEDYLGIIGDWKKRNPEKVKASQIVNKAIKDGKISKSKFCYDCKRKTSLSGHHLDYSRPLEVLWLCSSCHKLRHPPTY